MAEVARWPQPEAMCSAGRVADAVQDLVADVSIALTFPAERDDHRRAADRGVVRLRVLLRLAESLGYLTKRRMRFASAELDTIGRMLGGWGRSSRRFSKSGAGAGAPRPEARDARR
ncbi:hypothetical protein [Engelhardtia mirabilis]|uniref:hypothetical protein n=1 Tax=Engelhardtia mirabilis TaxID=2528011 RepID=UPI0011A4804F